MKISILAGSALTALVLTTPLHAQLVSADVVVRSGPVRGHVIIDNNEYSTYRRPAVVHEGPRLIVVERFRSHNDFRRWKRQGYRQIKVYFVNGRYYDREVRNVRGAREVVVYERDGRYYRDNCDRDERHDNYRDRDRDRDHWDH